MIKPASGKCNMICEYCFYQDEMKNRTQGFYGIMTDNTLKNVIRKTLLQATSEIIYAFQGGEPTLCGIQFFEKVLKYESQYNKQGITIHNVLQTNGYKIDEKWCEFFKTNHFLIGISIDGTKDIHDYYRKGKNGETTYDCVLRTTGLMDYYGVEYNILTVVTEKVANNCKKIYKEYKKKGWNYQQYIACLDPIDDCKGNQKYSLLPHEYGKFLVELFQLWYKDWLCNQQPYIRQFENYVGILMGYLPEACEQNGRCGKQIVVEADGSVFPCDFYAMDSYCLGNFNKNNLEFMNKTREKIGFIERSVKIGEKCMKCKWYFICRGGCQRNRVFDEVSGKYDNYLCAGYSFFFENCITDLKNVAEVCKKKLWGGLL